MSTPRQARDTARGRLYVHPVTGAEYPSVTTVLNIIDKPALKAWAAKQVAEYAVDHRDTWVNLGREAAVDLLKREPLRYTGRAADIGTAVHDAADRYVRGGSLALVERDPELQPFVSGFERFLSDFEPAYRYIEATVYSHTYGYAGTLDAVVELPGLGLYVLDIKTGAGVYGEAALQLAAYRHADELVTGPPWERTPMPETVGAVVLHLRPDVNEKGYELVHVDTEPAVLDAFFYAANLAVFWRAQSGTLVGDPLVPPTGAPGVTRADLRARLEAFPDDFLARAKAEWKECGFPALTRADDAWTVAKLEQAERFVTAYETKVADERSRVLQRCAIRCREVGLTDDERHELVASLTGGHRHGLSECTLHDLRRIEPLIDKPEEPF